jgi:hypothetical protein
MAEVLLGVLARDEAEQMRSRTLGSEKTEKGPGINQHGGDVEKRIEIPNFFGDVVAQENVRKEDTEVVKENAEVKPEILIVFQSQGRFDNF